VRPALAGIGAALALALAACGAGSSTSADKVPAVVSGSSWTSVRVSNGTTSADVPPAARKNLAPFLVSRVLAPPPAPLSEYGLHHPQATLTYTSRAGSTADVDIDQPNFDRHFVYVQRRGRPAVYLAPADALRPVLALVGVDIKPPD